MLTGKHISGKLFIHLLSLSLFLSLSLSLYFFFSSKVFFSKRRGNGIQNERNVKEK